jgi:hypothetical protein
MRYLTHCLFILLLMTFLQGCTTKKIIITASDTSLKITAEIIPEFKQFRDGQSQIKGAITIHNKTTSLQRFGSKFLILKVNDRLTARTYKDSVASTVIDFATVEIQPNASLNFKAYWVFNVPQSTIVKAMQLTIDEEGIKKEENGLTPPSTRRGISAARFSSWLIARAG